MVDGWVAIEVQEEVVVEADLARLLLVAEVDINGQDEAAIARFLQLVGRLFHSCNTQ